MSTYRKVTLVIDRSSWLRAVWMTVEIFILQDILTQSLRLMHLHAYGFAVMYLPALAIVILGDTALRLRGRT